MSGRGVIDRWTVPGGPTLGRRRWGGADGLPVVLLHGLSAGSVHWEPLGRRCADAGWSVSALDLRGHGDSDRVPGTYVIEHYAADVEAYLESFDRPVVLVGHSLGGAVSVFLAGARPDLVRGAFAEDPPLYHGDPEIMAATPYARVFRQAADDMRRLQAGDAGGVRAYLAGLPMPGGRFPDTVSTESFDARVESFSRADPEVWEPAIAGRALAGWDPERPVAVPLTILRADPALGAALTPDDAARFGAANPAATIVEITGASHGIREQSTTAARYDAELDRFLEVVRIVDAHERHETLAPISSRRELSMADAYAVQEQVVAARRARGEQRIGWKLGYTSLVMREQMGVDEPNFGPLTDVMLVDDGGDVAGRFTQPRVEPEVALWFGRDVRPGADRAAVLGAVASAHAALEVVDSVWTDYRFTIGDNTADGSSAAGVVVGPEIPLDRIADVAVTLLVDGAPVGSGHGRDASGHPADGVVWLVEQLAERGEHLCAGDIVITGGLTAAAPLSAGGEIRGEFDGDVCVTVRRSRS